MNKNDYPIYSSLGCVVLHAKLMRERDASETKIVVSPQVRISHPLYSRPVRTPTHGFRRHAFTQNFIIFSNVKLQSGYGHITEPLAFLDY